MKIIIYHHSFIIIVFFAAWPFVNIYMYMLYTKHTFWTCITCLNNTKTSIKFLKKHLMTYVQVYVKASTAEEIVIQERNWSFILSTCSITLQMFSYICWRARITSRFVRLHEMLNIYVGPISWLCFTLSSALMITLTLRRLLYKRQISELLV